MKKILIAMSLLLVFSFAAVGQEKRLSDAPESFRTFFASFKRAVEGNNKVAVANMTRFPFRYGFDEGDEGKYTRTQFIRNFKRIFDDPSEFFWESNPSFGIDDEDGRYYISTEDAASLGFVKSGRTYKFVSYVVLP